MANFKKLMAQKNLYSWANIENPDLSVNKISYKEF